MNDRVSTHAGRIKLRPVGGGSTTWLTYDMEMADEPTVIGTPLNKANLLSDTTANAIDDRYDTLPTTPNEALALLANGAARMEVQTYTGTGTYGSSNKNTLTFTHEPKLVLILGYRVNTGASAGDVNIIAQNCALLPWNEIKAAYTAEPSDATFNFLGASGSPVNKFTLSNSNKTITWYNTIGQTAQLNESNSEYTVISLY